MKWSIKQVIFNIAKPNLHTEEDFSQVIFVPKIQDFKGAQQFLKYSLWEKKTPFVRLNSNFSI